MHEYLQWFDCLSSAIIIKLITLITYFNDDAGKPVFSENPIFPDIKAADFFQKGHTRDKGRSDEKKFKKI